MKKKLNILVCPLNWGLGHASRDIPIISELIKREHNVIVAGSDNVMELLRTEFTLLEYLKFNGFNVTFPKKQTIVLHLLIRFPYFLFCIIKEHYQLKKIIRKLKIDVVISDNRFGLWNKNVYCVFITHQIMIKLPNKLKIFEQFVFKINRFFINNYDVCWIPDFEKPPNIAGELSHKYKVHLKTLFVGILSRFNDITNDNISEEKFEVIAIISGPEPHRSIFEKILLTQLQNLNSNCLIVTGKPNEKQSVQIFNNVKVVTHLSTNKMLNAIQNSKYIVSRSGYTTIMDLISLNRTAILVPTPGQTEQEYLSDYYSKKKIFLKMNQNEFDLIEALKNIDEYSPIIINDNCNLLNIAINKIEKTLS